MDKWIYESPDKGKTVVRRPFNSLNSNSIQVATTSCMSGWVPLSTVKTQARRALVEQKYRDQYPELNSLWKQYQTMLALLATEIDNDIDNQ